MNSHLTNNHCIKASLLSITSAKSCASTKFVRDLLELSSSLSKASSCSSLYFPFELLVSCFITLKPLRCGKLILKCTSTGNLNDCNSEISANVCSGLEDELSALWLYYPVNSNWVYHSQLNDKLTSKQIKKHLIV